MESDFVLIKFLFILPVSIYYPETFYISKFLLGCPYTVRSTNYAEVYGFTYSIV